MSPRDLLCSTRPQQKYTMLLSASHWLSVLEFNIFLLMQQSASKWYLSPGLRQDTAASISEVHSSLLDPSAVPSSPARSLFSQYRPCLCGHFWYNPERRAASSCLLPQWPSAALSAFPLKFKLLRLSYGPSRLKQVSGHERTDNNTCS